MRWIAPGLGLIAAAMALALPACSPELTGPSPQLQSPTDAEPTTDPSFSCSQQLEAWITIKGQGFSPLVVDTIDSDKEPSLALPTLKLVRSADVNGQADDQEKSVTLQSAGQDAQVRWIDDKTIQVKHSPDLALLPGVYDLSVTNANGNSASQPAAFGVVAPPSISGLEPELTCVAQGQRTLVISGQNFLVHGDKLPSFTIADKTYPGAEPQDCAALADIFGGAQLCQKLSITIAQEDLPAGTHDVQITNPAPAACVNTPDQDASRLTIVAPPQVSGVDTEPLCATQLDYAQLKISGQGFIALGAQDQQTLPSVRIGDKTYLASAAEQCEPINTLKSTLAQRCSSLTISVPAGDHAQALGVDDTHIKRDVAVINPDPVGCQSEEDAKLTFVPEPQVSQISPNLVCLAQGQGSLSVTGRFFLGVDAALPEVLVDGQSYPATALGDCQDLPTDHATGVKSCTSLEVTLPMAAIDAGIYALEVVNPAPAACTSSQGQQLINVPPPSLAAVAQGATCLSGQGASLTLQGQGFITQGGELPAVVIGGVMAQVTDAQDCQPFMGEASVQSCNTLQVELAQDTLQPGDHLIQVTNPGSITCANTEMISLTVLDGPQVQSVTPDFFCNQGQEITINVTGVNFYKVGNLEPNVVIDGQSFTADSTSGCAPLAQVTDAQACTGLSVRLPAGSATPGPQDIFVQGPAPLACLGSASSALIAGPPVIAQAAPAQVCSGAGFDGMVTLTGSNFLQINGQNPTITANGQALTATLSQCAPVAQINGAQACAQIDLSVPLALRDQAITFELTNPTPANCGSSSIVLPLEPTPQIDTVTPLRLCYTGGSLNLQGQDFQQSMSVSLGATQADMVSVNMTGTQATATFNSPPTAGEYTLSATNPNSCTSDFSTPVRVVEGPKVFFVDPPITYNGINTQVTIYVSGLYGGLVTSAALVDDMGNQTMLAITVDPAKPNTVQAVIPKDLLPANTPNASYDLIVTDDVNCAGLGQDLLKITNELNLAIDTISPPFGWTSSTTGVTITAKDPAPQGQVQFAPTPRAYINPSNAQPGDIARELRSVLFNDATELSGIVPDGLPVGDYDVIVINPDGSVGLLPAGFQVTQEPPPLIDTVTPGSWKTNEAALAVTITGQNFRNPTTEIFCQDPGGAIDQAVTTVTTFTADTISMTANTSTLDHLSVCYIRVTNDDNTWAEYAPITVTNPAGNFVSFKPGTMMTVARRWAAATSSAPSRSARFIYSIGGDDGALAGAKSSLEAAPLNRFGEPGDWFELRNALPAPRTGASAVRVEDFVYLVGGHDGTQAVNTVLRAQVLDPLRVPSITNVELGFDEFEIGIAAGVYYYRVSAVMAANDPYNPGGETLASEPQAVRVPGGGIDLTLAWAPVQGAVEYRVYRSAAPDQPVGNEELLAVVQAPTTSFNDNSQTMTTMGVKPLPLGSLGVWHQVATLNQARYAHGATSAPDPDTANTHYLYAIAGHSGASVLGSYEHLQITVTGPGQQSIATTATTGLVPLLVPRHELKVLTGTPDNSSYLSGPVIYVLGGKTATGTSRRIDYATVNNDGTLGLWVQTSDMQRTRAGYAAALANNNMVTAAGQNASPSSTADKGELCDGVACPTPGIDRWSSLANVNLLDRYLVADVSFNGFLYICGGVTAGNVATDTIDYSPLGGTP